MNNLIIACLTVGGLFFTNVSAANPVVVPVVKKTESTATQKKVVKKKHKKIENATPLPKKMQKK